MKLDDNTFKYYANFIFDELGIVYNETNAYQLENRLVEVCKLLEFESVDELSKKTNLHSNKKLRDLLLDLSTNNETLFFRDRPIFEKLPKNVLDPFMNSGPSHPFKVWSAACSTGQEVYSLIFTLEKYRNEHPLFRYEIIASDFSERVLAQAKSGKYKQLEVQRGLSSVELLQYFERSSTTPGVPAEWQVKSDYRKHVTFKHINLKKDWNLHMNFNLILCRNVLIYQDKEGKNRILERIHDRLSKDGVLVLGNAESMIDLRSHFEPKIDDSAVYYLKKEAQARFAG